MMISEEVEIVLKRFGARINTYNLRAILGTQYNEVCFVYLDFPPSAKGRITWDIYAHVHV